MRHSAAHILPALIDDVTPSVSPAIITMYLPGQNEVARSNSTFAALSIQSHDSIPRAMLPSSIIPNAFFIFCHPT
jgi:hypothetical protein